MTPAKKSDILSGGCQFPHKERQDRVHRSVAHLDHHGGEKEAEHQFWIIQRAEKPRVR
ncbi:Uncharacterised protein [Pantoea agglomerans]|uniref:Uncharacterized protein n=1 Tax=Enterobacter agglomerans TaxID=549 RepID=A0A379AJT9_ENTAG|nr:Uncharacterised protein [Pantoea agglomerans]